MHEHKLLQKIASFIFKISCDFSLKSIIYMFWGLGTCSYSWKMLQNVKLAKFALRPGAGNMVNGILRKLVFLKVQNFVIKYLLFCFWWIYELVLGLCSLFCGLLFVFSNIFSLIWFTTLGIFLYRIKILFLYWRWMVMTGLKHEPLPLLILIQWWVCK